MWFPPALNCVEQVDEFFKHFAREKIPYVASPDGQLATGNTPAASTSTQIAGRKSPHPATVSLASSYRDEQISFQLPRQDISLDYCSYQMDESSRQNYQQFVEKRNCNALDVGTVIQVRYFGSSSCLEGKQNIKQRKASTASQQNVPITFGATTETSGAAAGQPNTHLQRCRRCLVRFDEGQLAVVAPNFVIGTRLYRNSTANAPPGSVGVNVPVAAAANRRRRASTVRAPLSTPRSAG